ncbi:MAG: class I SAM-dependent methyltransferase [Myxococcales bacterium]|nr:class I SAM-dependent methyltransferase [Myxococcales bacterium]
MERVLEPEVMDTVADATEYDAMDFDEPNLRFALAALALIEPRASPEILDVGTGTARIPILMAERRAGLSIVAADLAREMIRLGEENVARAGLREVIRLQVMDAKRLRSEDRRYDLVMCNSTIHHLPDPIAGLREIARVVKSDGSVIIRDLARPASTSDAWAIVKRAAAGESPRQQQLFFDSLCAALTPAEVERALEQAGLGALQVSMVSDRHWSAEGRLGG